MDLFCSLNVLEFVTRELYSNGQSLNFVVFFSLKDQSLVLAWSLTINPQKRTIFATNIITTSNFIEPL